MRGDLSGFSAVAALVLIISGINILVGGRVSPNQSFSLGNYGQYVGAAFILTGLIVLARLKLRARGKDRER